jgi:opine dehydrogenase
VEVFGYDAKEQISAADVILISVPSYAYGDVLRIIAPSLRPDTWVGSVPGTGGFEYVAREILGHEALIFGCQRVPYISRIEQYGEAVHISGRRPLMHFAALRPLQGSDVQKRMEAVFGIETKALRSYLEVTLTPSNPILHTARLYVMFREYVEGRVFPEELLFYETWDENSSEVLLSCDAELQAVCRALPIDLRGVASLRKHYESENAAELCAKIRSIPAFKGLKAPMRRVAQGWAPDFSSRYFAEDVPYGLVILKAIALVAGVATPTMDEILMWAQKQLGQEYLLTNGRLLGKDTGDIFIPQNFGLSTAEALVAFYLN